LKVNKKQYTWFIIYFWCIERK